MATIKIPTGPQANSPGDCMGVCPSASPSVGPSASPSASPNAGPSASPSASPNAGPSASPSASPNAGPNAGPSANMCACPNVCTSAGMLANLFKPVYHFAPPSGWINDPNGLLWHAGYYHVFYQHNPNGDAWGDIHWGHARSADLLNWEHMPIALAPSTGRGELHCFSGSAVVQGTVPEFASTSAGAPEFASTSVGTPELASTSVGAPTIFYTSIGGEGLDARDGARQWRARSYDGMLTWVKDDSPALTDGIHDTHVQEWRDPFVWNEGGTWRMLLGGFKDGRAVVLGYSSCDLETWGYDGVFLEDRESAMVECPNLIPFGDKKLLFYSPGAEVVWHVGAVGPDGAFISERRGVLDHSGTDGFYAPAALTGAPGGRPLVWGWITENARGGYPIPGYSGAFSLPRLICPGPSGMPDQAPVPEISLLRGQQEHIPELRLDGSEVVLKTVGRAVEVGVAAEYGEADDFSLYLLETPDREESVEIRFIAAERRIVLNRGRAGTDGRLLRGSKSMVLDANRSSGTAGANAAFCASPCIGANASASPCIGANANASASSSHGAESGTGICGKLDIRVYLDHSTIEAFVAGQAMTARVYIARSDAGQIRVAGRLRKAAVSAYNMNPLTYTFYRE